MAASEEKLFLFDHPVSSYAQKVRIALREKDIPFDFKTPDGLGTGQDNEAFLNANPRLEVPALVDGDFKIFDSTVILQYIEDKYPERPLLPTGAKGRAHARMIEDVCDTQFEAINWGYSEIVYQKRASGELADKLVEEIRHQSSQVQAWLEAKLGDTPYFNGDSFGYADACVAPMLNRSVLTGNGPAAGSPLQKWHERIQERPSIKTTFEEVTEGMKRMANLGDYFQKEGRSREYRDHRLEWMIKSGGIDVIVAGLKNKTIRFCRLPNK